ncbi:secreted protein [Colletotrichum tofieldiae]|nr:secreted protein [Colletotrichum tofieldiae]
MYGVAAGEIDAYISWNGDTEVAVWKFFAEPLEDRNRERLLLGQVRRTGFETYLKLDSGTVTGEILVSAQALDANNRVLANTNSVVILRNPLGPSGLPGKPSQEVIFEEL